MKRACIRCGMPTVSGPRCPRHVLRARPRGNVFEPTRQRILARDGYRCQLRLDGCTTAATVVDHIVPFAHGGTEADANLQAACDHCNKVKGAGDR